MSAKFAIAIATVAIIASLAVPAISGATGDATEIRFHDGKFDPTVVAIPANRPVTLHVVNASDSAIEFESFKLNREKAVGPGESITVSLPALDPGNYDFYDDFHQNVPEGNIVAK